MAKTGRQCPQQRDSLLLTKSLGVRTVVRPRVDSRSPMIGLMGLMDHREPRASTGLMCRCSEKVSSEGEIER